VKFTPYLFLLSVLLVVAPESGRTASPKGGVSKPLPQITTRIKDIASFEGMRGNQLIGYGLVVGLQGTGDNAKSSPLRESLAGMLGRLGVKVDLKASDMKTKNTAVVMVTTILPPFARHGTHIDVTVSALADAKSLLGGVLLATPLVGADGETYVLAQGPIAVGGYTFGGDTKQGQMQTVTKGVPTNGRVPNGGIVEKEVPFELAQQDSLRIMLRNPDFTTAKRVSDVINTQEQRSIAKATDPSTIVIDTSHHKGDLVAFITRIEQLSVKPDQQARIIFDDRDGVVVINENVRISPVAVAHGSLMVKITETDHVTPMAVPGNGWNYNSYPPSYPGYYDRQGINNDIRIYQEQKEKASQGTQTGQNTQGTQTDSQGEQVAKTDQGTQTPSRRSRSQGRDRFGPYGNSSMRTRQTTIDVDEGNARDEKLGILAPGASLQELVNALNALGISPRDMITVLQAIKEAGALQAQMETM
jgi:flagellar P-ring protein precursor FlgI